MLAARIVPSRERDDERFRAALKKLHLTVDMLQIFHKDYNSHYAGVLDVFKEDRKEAGVYEEIIDSE